jgi:hypothetical protein
VKAISKPAQSTPPDPQHVMQVPGPLFVCVFTLMYGDAHPVNAAPDALQMLPASLTHQVSWHSNVLAGGSHVTYLHGLRQ